MVPMLVQQVDGLTDDLPGWLDRANRFTDRWLGTSVTTSQLQSTLTSSTSDLAGSLLGLGTKLASGFFKLLTIGLFAFYLVADGPRVRRVVCSVLRPQRQREVLWAWDVAIAKTGGYLYSRLLLAAISTAATFAVLLLLGVPFALPLALWVGTISQFIPVVGTYIALTVPVLVALAHSPVAAVVLLVFLVLYQQVENYLLSPRVTARTMALHPAIALGAVIAGGSLYGAIGAFLALPAAAILQAGLSTYLTRHEVIDSELTRLRQP
jgi:predicted PurR-regulated permease PerM